MKTIVLFFMGLFFAAQASAFYDIATKDLPKGFDLNALAGTYKNNTNDTAEVRVVSVEEGAGFNVRIDFKEGALPEYYGDFYFDGEDIKSISEDGTVVLYRSTDCEDVECQYGETTLTFAKNAEGKYTLKASIDFSAEVNDAYGWSYDNENNLPIPTDAGVTTFCKDEFKNEAAYGFFNDDVHCSIQQQSTLFQN